MPCTQPSQTPNSGGTKTQIPSESGNLEVLESKIHSVGSKSQAIAGQTASGITLTAHQQTALDQLHAFLDSPERMFVLAGYAGTGKTTLLQAFISQLQDRGDRRVVVFSAFTNKATKVLNQMVSAWGLDVDCLTCCQLLGLRPQIDPETGEQEFIPDPDQENSFGKFAW